ncbi:hypothetical protein S40293_10625 [Stachybotrys chartarum IBT 40293]|nr:hypothetical protein S40293_10625 [Stachybotrys chartarum IBT 40293]
MDLGNCSSTLRSRPQDTASDYGRDDFDSKRTVWAVDNEADPPPPPYAGELPDGPDFPAPVGRLGGPGLAFPRGKPRLASVSSCPQSPLIAAAPDQWCRAVPVRCLVPLVRDSDHEGRPTAFRQQMFPSKPLRRPMLLVPAQRVYDSSVQFPDANSHLFPGLVRYQTAALM